MGIYAGNARLILVSLSPRELGSRAQPDEASGGGDSAEVDASALVVTGGTALNCAAADDPVEGGVRIVQAYGLAVLDEATPTRLDRKPQERRAAVDRRVCRAVDGCADCCGSRVMAGLPSPWSPMGGFLSPWGRRA
ncbi:hypothetical protein ACVWZD_009020 [Streptomyces sp. TE3672]